MTYDIQPEEFFIAEGNLNYKEKETSEDEGVRKDDDTIKTLNLPAPATAEEPPSEAIRSGPLTFDPRPLEEEDEHTTLAASDNQAELMALLPWPLTFLQAQATRHQWQNPQEARQGRATQVRRLSLWRYDEDSLARQRDQGFSRSLCCNQAGGVHLH
jgi:hypothetical protein